MNDNTLSPSIFYEVFAEVPTDVTALVWDNKGPLAVFFSLRNITIEHYKYPNPDFEGGGGTIDVPPSGTVSLLEMLCSGREGGEAGREWMDAYRRHHAHRLLACFTILFFPLSLCLSLPSGLSLPDVRDPRVP